MASLLALLLAAAGPATTAFPPPRPLVPFVYDTMVDDCVWTMHDKSEKWTRGGIGRGDDDPLIDFVDYAFDGWSARERHAIEVSVGDPARRLPVSAWSSNADGQAPGSATFFMNAEMRRLIGGATSLQIWKDGKPVFNTILAGTPTAAQLDACVRPPSDPADTDEE